MPNIGQRIITRKIPPKKAMIPLIRSRREKKRTVRENPMVRVKPARNSKSPNANNAESKRNNIPKKRKMHPRKRRPVPILVLSLTIVIVCNR
mmetsp:Transcript_27656/g.36735  ORF Transcript_27656/g.36735 Transcript_27656/m.36735 type:complete len:92 (-) Transcript_27656:209-484(-)